MGRITATTVAFAIVSTLSLAAPGTASADDVADFYNGKTIRVVIGFGAGGGYDLYGRMAAAYMGKFMPGHPTFQPQNMGGAGGRRAALFCAKAAPKDGTVLCVPNMHLALEGMLDPKKGAQLDVGTLNWIGRMAQSIDIGLAWHTSGIKSVDDAKKRPVAVAASGTTSTAAMVPWALNKIAGTKFKVVLGYRGSRSFTMAMLQGEADAQSAIGWTTLKSRRADWLRDNKVTLLWQLATARDKELPNVPAFPEFGKTAVDKGALKLIASSGRIGRTLFAPPGVPADRVAALRAAFDKMVADPGFLADMKKRKVDIDPLPGAQVTELIKEAISAPKEVVERARWAIQPEKSERRKGSDKK